MSDGKALVRIDYSCATTLKWIRSGGMNVWRQFCPTRGDSSVVLDWDRVESLLSMSRHLPGWTSGETNSPNPLIIEDVDD